MEAVFKELNELASTAIQKAQAAAAAHEAGWKAGKQEREFKQAVEAFEARLRAALQCQGCDVPKDGVYQISEPSHSMSQYASKDDIPSAAGTHHPSR